MPSRRIAPTPPGAGTPSRSYDDRGTTGPAHSCHRGTSTRTANTCSGAASDRASTENSNRSLIADLHHLGQRQGLAGEDPALVEVLLLEDVVVQHRDLTLDQLAGARAAVALTAGVRRVEPLGQQDVQQLGLLRPGHLAG